MMRKLALICETAMHPYEHHVIEENWQLYSFLSFAIFTHQSVK